MIQVRKLSSILFDMAGGLMIIPFIAVLIVVPMVIVLIIWSARLIKRAREDKEVRLRNAERKNNEGEY